MGNTPSSSANGTPSDNPAAARPTPTKTQSAPAVATRASGTNSGTGSGSARISSYDRYLRRALPTAKPAPPAATPPVEADEGDARSIRLEDARTSRGGTPAGGASPAPPAPAALHGSGDVVRQERSARELWRSHPSIEVVRLVAAGLVRQDARAAAAQAGSPVTLRAAVADAVSPVGLRAAVADAMEPGPAARPSEQVPEPAPQGGSEAPAPTVDLKSEPVAEKSEVDYTKESAAAPTSPESRATRPLSPGSVPFPSVSSPTTPLATDLQSQPAAEPPSPPEVIDAEEPQDAEHSDVEKKVRFAEEGAADAPVEGSAPPADVPIDSAIELEGSQEAEAFETVEAVEAVEVVTSPKPGHVPKMSTDSTSTTATLIEDIAASIPLPVGADSPELLPAAELAPSEPVIVDTLDHEALSDATDSELGEHDSDIGERAQDRDRDRDSVRSGSSTLIHDDVEIKKAAAAAAAAALLEAGAATEPAANTKQALLPVIDVQLADLSLEPEPVAVPRAAEASPPMRPASVLLGDGASITLDVSPGLNNGLGTRTPVEPMSPVESMAAARALLGDGPTAEEDSAETASRELTEGTYQLVNVEDGMAVDLSAGDNISVITWHPHEEDNQQWEFRHLGKGFSIRNVASGGYLSLEGALAAGGRLVATDYPIAWKVDRVRSGGIFRICWPGTDLTLGLDQGTNHAQLLPSGAAAAPRKLEWAFYPTRPKLSEADAAAEADPETPSLHTTVHTRVNQDGAEHEWPVISRTVPAEPAKRWPAERGDVIEETTTTTTTVTTVTTVRRLAPRA